MNGVIPERFYRISAKALILNETKDKFLVCEEASGVWELPGGGLEWGESPEECIERELQEEMGLQVMSVAPNPAYFSTFQFLRFTGYGAAIIFETTVEHLNFTPSDECVNIKFVDHDTIEGMQVFPTIIQLAEQFDPVRHR